jgi:DNA-binding protein Fis
LAIANDHYKELLYTFANLGVPMEQLITQVRKDYARAAYRITKGNKSKAAILVGVHRNTMSRIILHKGGS